MARKPNGKKRRIQSDTFERLVKYWNKDVESKIKEFLEELKMKRSITTENTLVDGINPQTFQPMKYFNCKCYGVCRGYCKKKELE